MTLLLNRSSIQQLLTMDATINILEQAFIELADGSSIMPQRTAVSDLDKNGWYAFMPAQLKTMGALGVKAVTVYKDNVSKHNLPVTLATILLMDNNTGETTCVMDGGYITAMRTGAVSGLATKYLSREDASVAGVLGTGVQARAQLIGIATAHKLSKAFCFSMDTQENQAHFAESVASETGLTVSVSSSAQELVQSCDILALATTATTPIVDGDWVKNGTHINAIGSHAPGVRELDSKTMKRSKIVCDNIEACLAEAGDIQIPLKEGVLSKNDLQWELADLVTGKTQVSEGKDDITLMKTVGLSIQDISVAYHVYKQAKEKGVGSNFDF